MRVVLALLCGLSAVPAAAADIVTVSTGSIRGTTEPSGVLSFKAIPFAAPPVGPLRWRPPAPVAAWHGILDGRHFGHACMQLPEKPGSFYERESGTLTDISEDCLTLNVWSPPHPPGRRLPVLVWFYGGAWVVGGASKPVYDGAALARLGMVVVTPNYRVGAFGFLAHPGLSAESSAGTSGNYGLEDEVAALRWVRSNISQLGGDPAQVTIAGQSAGGLSVDFLMSMPGARGLFTRAIVESGANVGAGPAYATLRGAETAGEAYLRNRGARTVAEARALPAAVILEANPADRSGSLACQTCAPGFAPIIDGKLVPAAPAVAFRHHREAPVPLMIGTTANEISAFTPRNVTPDSYVAWANARWGDQAAALMRFYAHDTSDAAWRAKVQGASDNGLAGSRLQAGQHAADGTPTFLYRFEHAPPGRDSDVYGAFHGAELAYVFGTQDTVQRPWTPDDRALSKTMMTYWANFVRSGNPNGDGLARWPAYDETNDTMMHLDTVAVAGRVPLPARAPMFTQQLNRLVSLQENQQAP